MSETPPARVQLAHPLLSAWREAGVLQVGCAGRWFVLRDVPELLPGVIEALAMPHTRAELCALVPGLDPGWIDWLCQHLSSAGLLTHRSAAQRAVLVCGRGRLAATTLSALLVAGLRPRQVPARTDLLPADALLVVAAETAEPDRMLLNRLTRSGVDHLVVRAEPARACVGPRG